MNARPLLLCHYVILFFSLFVPLRSLARPISDADASRAVRRWLTATSSPMAQGLSLPPSGPGVVTAVDSHGRALFHMVKVEGGCVFTSADDTVRPIVAITTTEKIPGNDRNPLWALVKQGMETSRAGREGASTARSAPARATASSLSPSSTAAQEAWSALLATAPSRLATPSLRSSGNDLYSISDIRVPPLIRSNWGQANGIFNHDITNHFPCGALATSLAQLMRFHGYPTNPVPPVTRTCVINRLKVQMTMKGGLYEWEKMPLDTTGFVPEESKNAIGKLCYDIGVATYAQWGPYGSGSPPYGAVEALLQVFGYANATGYTIEEEFQGPTIPDPVVARLVRSNLDAGLPVVVSLGGHSVLADGYGYEGNDLFVHLNMGWDGLYDAWYNLPHVANGYPYESHSVDAVQYNISPTESGALLTGRLTDTAGQVVTGALVRATSGTLLFTTHSNSNGLYALWVSPDKSYDVSALSGEKKGMLTSVFVQGPVPTYSEGATYVPMTGTPGNSDGNDIVLSPFCPSVEERGGQLEISTEPPYLPPSSALPPPGLLSGLTNGQTIHLASAPVALADGRHFRCTGYALEDKIPLPALPPNPYPPVSDVAFSQKANTLLGSTGILWETSGEYPWVEDIRTKWQDRQGLVSQGDGHGPADSWLEATVLGPGTLRFAYRKSIVASTVTWLLDGECIHTDTDFIHRGPWEEQSIHFREGWHRLRFNYHHGGAGFNGEFTGVNIARATLDRDETVIPSPSVTNLMETAFDYRHAGKSKRVTWLYELDGYRLDAAATIPMAGTILCSPPPDLSEGCYSTGTKVTLQATPFPPYRFSHWEGASSGREPLDVVVDRPLCVRAVFTLDEARWRYDPAAKTLTDGNWLLDVAPTLHGHDLSAYRSGSGLLDLTDVEVDTGIRLVRIRAKVFSSDGNRTIPLTSAILPDSLVSIGKEAFADCESLSTIALSPKTESIGSGAFFGCTSLAIVTPFLPETLTSLGPLSFSGCTGLAGDLVLANEALKALPSNFDGTAIRSADLRHLHEIAPFSFSHCLSLAKVRLDRVTAIGDEAFARCPLLARIDLGPAPITIGQGAFERDAEAASFYFHGLAPKRPLGGRAFHPGAGRYKIHVDRRADPAGWKALSTPVDERDLFDRSYPGDGTFAILPVEGGRNWLIDWTPPTPKATMILIR